MGQGRRKKMLIFGFLMQLILIAVIAYLLGSRPWYGVRLNGSHPNHLESLKERYARGELSHEMFEELWQELE